MSENASTDGVLLVDVGGSLGHDMVKFKERFRQAPGRLIVQDLASVLAQAKEDSDVEMMAHDFFTEQPVKGTTSSLLISPGLMIVPVRRSWVLLTFSPTRLARRGGGSNLAMPETCVQARAQQTHHQRMRHTEYWCRFHNHRP